MSSHAWLGPLVVAFGLGAFASACSSPSPSDASGPASDSGMTGPADASQEAASEGDAAEASSPADATADSPASAPDAAMPSGDAGLPAPLGPVPDGGELVQFVKTDESTYFDPAQENKATGTITFGAANASASDGLVADLTRTGGQAAIGTAGAEEIVSNRTFSFGTFRYRASLAACASTEEAVNGLFTYWNDGSLAPDGLVVNREIDIEILCGEPWLINLTIWTEYTDDTHLQNQSRVVDTRTGTVYVYASDQEGNQTGTENHPELVVPGFPAAGTFYEMGFTWTATDVRYFLNVGGSYVTLWDATDATRIPQLPMEQHFNLWAPGIHWSTGAKAAPPAADATLAPDWFRYDPL